MKIRNISKELILSFITLILFAILAMSSDENTNNPNKGQRKFSIEIFKIKIK